MRQIIDVHVTVPGLAVVHVAAADDETAFTVQELLAAHPRPRRRGPASGPAGRRRGRRSRGTQPGRGDAPCQACELFHGSVAFAAGAAAAGLSPPPS
ncbi:DUF6207 family protein [Streptomyces sp. NPDC001698]|uniref:DUF6207 family protein n=1 Tax=Streptomyces sp. NPDC001698 TaxID=3364601 RepID=UPI0036764103